MQSKTCNQNQWIRNMQSEKYSQKHATRITQSIQSMQSKTCNRGKNASPDIRKHASKNVQPTSWNQRYAINYAQSENANRNVQSKPWFWNKDLQFWTINLWCWIRSFWFWTPKFWCSMINFWFNIRSFWCWKRIFWFWIQKLWFWIGH